MKRFIMLLMVSIVLSACSNSNTKPEEDNDGNQGGGSPVTVVSKIDASKDWVLSENVSEFDPFVVYADNETVIESLKSKIEMMDKDSYMVKLKRQSDPERINSAFKLTLNFKSQDSESIQKVLDASTKKALDYQNAWETSEYVNWAQFDILNYTVTDTHIFLGTRLLMYTFNSGAYFEEFNSWVIDLKTGKTLDFEETLGVLGVSQENVETELKSKEIPSDVDIVTYHGNFEEVKAKHEALISDGGNHVLLLDAGFGVPMLMEDDPGKIVIIGSRASSQEGILDKYTIVPYVEIIDK